MGKGQNEGGFSEDQILVHLDLVFGEAALKGFHILSKMGKGQNEGGFSEDQIQMYKDCFKLRTSTRMESLTRTTSVAPSTTSVSSCPSLSLMDINKDGILDKNDLRGAFDNVGVLM